jgi:hypothetical protein
VWDLAEGARRLEKVMQGEREVEVKRKQRGRKISRQQGNYGGRLS